MLLNKNRHNSVIEITAWAQEYFTMSIVYYASHKCRLNLYQMKKTLHVNMIQNKLSFMCMRCANWGCTAGLTQRDRQLLTITRETIWNQSGLRNRSLGETRSTQREVMQAQREHANSTKKGPGWPAGGFTGQPQ